MTNWMSRVLVVAGVCVVTSVACGAPVAAQQSPSPSADKNAVVLIPGVLTGPGTMGPRGYKRLCTPRSVGLYEWQVRWIEQVVRPTEAQRAALNDLQSASSKAIATMATACKAERPTTTKAEPLLDRRKPEHAMSFSTMMVHVDVEHDSEQRVELAIDLADRFQATLIGVAGCALWPAFMAGDVGLTESSQYDLQKVTARFEHRGEMLRTQGRSLKRIEWRSALEHPGELLLREARAADLLIIGCKRGGDDADPGVIVAAEVWRRPRGPVAAELLHVVQEEKADLIVAGGYGHSRWVNGFSAASRASF